jgi:hypothetical protein
MSQFDMSASIDSFSSQISEAHSEELINRVTNSESDRFLSEWRRSAKQESTPQTHLENSNSTQQDRSTTSQHLQPEDLRFPEGNIHVLLADHNGRIVEGNVCSQAMSLFSPVWKQLVVNVLKHNVAKTEDEPTGNELLLFNELKDQQGAEYLDFTADEIIAIWILLNIAHMNTRSVPRNEMQYKELLNMAVLIHKYDCLAQVEVFHKGWLADQEFQVYRDGMENWLFIAWVFGRNQAFEGLADKLVVEMKISGEGTAITATGGTLEEPIPLGIIESIHQVRLVMISRLLDIWYGYINSLLRNGSLLCRHGEVMCDNLAHGSLTKAMSNLDLYPQKNASQISSSIDELRSKLISNRLNVLPSHNPAHQSLQVPLGSNREDDRASYDEHSESDFGDASSTHGKCSDHSSWHRCGMAR